MSLRQFSMPVQKKSGNLLKALRIYIYIYIGLVVKVFISGQADRASIPVWVMSKTQKMVHDVSLLNIQHKKVWIKCSGAIQGKGVSPFPKPQDSCYWKGTVRVPRVYGRQITYGLYIYIYIYIYIYMIAKPQCSSRIRRKGLFLSRVYKCVTIRLNLIIYIFVCLPIQSFVFLSTYQSQNNNIYLWINQSIYIYIYIYMILYLSHAYSIYVSQEVDMYVDVLICF